MRFTFVSLIFILYLCIVKIRVMKNKKVLENAERPSITKGLKDPWLTIYKDFYNRLSVMTFEEQKQLEKQLIDALYGHRK